MLIKLSSFLGATANFGGKYFVERFTVVQRPGGERSHVDAPVVKALGDDNVDRPNRGLLNGYCTNGHD